LKNVVVVAVVNNDSDDPPIPPNPALIKSEPQAALPSNSIAAQEEDALSRDADPEHQKGLRDNYLAYKQAETKTAVLKNDILAKEDRRLFLENWRIGIDIVLRVIACIAIPLLFWWWLGRVLSIVEKQQSIFWSFSRLSDPSMVALLGTTSINVIGLLTIIVRYYFREEKSKEKTVKSTHS
jgi:hypothetical protein